MRFRTGLWAIAGLALACPAVFAQALPTQPGTDDRLDRLERRLNEMEQKHQSDLRARDEEIARLKAQLQAQSRPSGPATEPTTREQIDRAARDILGEIESNQPQAPTLRVPASFNPDLAVVGDFRGNISTASDNPARNRFDIGSVELDLRAAVDPRADGVVVLPVVRDVEDPLFFDKADAAGDVSSGIEIEEAYLFLHDFGVPNLTAKLGRYHLRFGRQNILHAHNWPTVDNNFVNQSFLGAEAISDAGLSLSYVVPPRLTGNNYIEAIVELVSGEGEGPVINNSAFVDSPGVNTHLLWNHDIARGWNLEAGGSFLAGRHEDRNDQDVFLYGGDITLVHTDPTGGFNNQLFQGEAVYGDVGTTPDETQHAVGFYLLAQQQINRDWYVGIRGDWTENALDDNQEVWGVSPYVTWYWSEFLRFRVEYQHKAGDVPSEDTVWFQVTFVYGAHPPHPYWAMR